MKRLRRWLFGESPEEIVARFHAELEAQSFQVGGRRYVRHDPERTRRLLGRGGSRYGGGCQPSA